MRILAIRGQNLASLAERFDLDFAAAPLAGAGLFAITGETGAGKSTILDAMCLALYGEFPRIGRDRGSDEKIPDVGEEKIRVTDPASILRQGAPTGFAEVDFLARDGHRYRARWSVARARGKPDGRLQDPMRRLDRLDDSGAVVLGLADKTRAVDKAVLDLTDLTFEQFTRTVLLSQGDFDAFLRAKDGERAELLEKITGTDLYAKVSVEVFERTRAAEKAVAALEERRAMIPVLSEAERAALAERIAAIGTESEALRTRADTETAELGRAERIIAAEAEVAAAEAALGTARAASEAAADDRAHLAALRSAQAVRPAFDRLTEATLRLDRAETALREATGTVAKATEAANLAQEQLTTAEGASEAARRDVERFDPIWAAAMRLDGAIVDARRERDSAAEAVTKDERQAVEQRDALDAAKAQVEARGTGLAEIETALATSAGIAALAGRWADLAPLIDERLREMRTGSDAAQAIAALGRTIADCDARLAALAEADGKDATERADRTAQLDERRAARAAIDVAGLEARREAVETLGRAIAELRRLFEDAAERTETCREVRDRRTAAEAAARAAGEQLEKLGQERTTTTEQRARHQALADFADQVLSVHAGRLRAELAEGEPCPVCGSTHHPATDAALTARAEQIRTERATLDKAIADLDTAIAAGRGELAAHQAASNDAADRIAKAEERLAALVPEIATRTAAIVETALALGLKAAGEPQPATVADLDLWREHTSNAYKQARDALRAAATLDAEIEALRRAIEALDAARELRRTERDADIAARAEAALAETAARSRLEAANRRLVEIDVRLTAPLGEAGFEPADLDRDPERVQALLTEKVEARQRLEASVEPAREALRQAEATADRAASTEAAARAALAKCRDALVHREATLARLSDERAALLDGEATEAHRARILLVQTAADRTRDDARGALAKANADLAGTRAAEAAAATARAEAEAARTACQEAWTVAARSLDRSEAELEALLAAAAEIEPLAARLTELDAALDRAGATLADRRATLEGALVDGRPEHPIEAIRAAIAALREQETALAEERGRLQAETARNAETTAEAARLDAEIAQARDACSVWQAVNAAVGSREGDKFRRVAQEITLDRLTALANRHLKDLAPRYRLSRVDGLGLTVVDRDMGDEIRSTRSLSGGERFLTSLALALALSGLEGRQSFVETLFIDEGFGSLDAGSLELAIDALESLQSQGRKVGVISHVPAMHERIPVQIRVERAGQGRSRVEIVERG